LIEPNELAWILAAGLATGIGGLVLLAFPKPSDLLLDALLGFTAGVMLAATAFSLLVPALDLGSLAEVLLGFALGGALLLGLAAAVPHVHARFAERGHEDADVRRANRGLLLISALTIHNVPEGMAVGVAFAAGGPELGVPIAIASASYPISSPLSVVATRRSGSTEARAPARWRAPCSAAIRSRSKRRVSPSLKGSATTKGR